MGIGFHIFLMIVCVMLIKFLRRYNGWMDGYAELLYYFPFNWFEEEVGPDDEAEEYYYMMTMHELF